MNFHEYFQQVFSRDNPEGDAYGWIQWKGTDVCIDLHCECGAHMHFDGGFFYNFACPHCGRKYATGMNIKLIELSEEESEVIEIWTEVQPDKDFELYNGCADNRAASQESPDSVHKERE